MSGSDDIGEVHIVVSALSGGAIGAVTGHSSAGSGYGVLMAIGAALFYIMALWGLSDVLAHIMTGWRNE